MDELSSLDQILLAGRKLNTWGGRTRGELGDLLSSLWILVCVPELHFGVGRELRHELWAQPPVCHILLLSPAEEDELDPS